MSNNAINVGNYANDPSADTLYVAFGKINTTLPAASAGLTWTAGTGAPSSSQPKGSLYSRLDGGVGSTLYVTQGSGIWNAVGGV